MIKAIFKLAESGWLPDVIIKIGAKFLSQKRLADPSLVDQKKQLLKDFAAGAIAEETAAANEQHYDCLLYTSPSPRDRQKSRMPSSA